MASRRATTKALAPLLRRSVTTARTSSKAMRGGMSPPMPAIARIPAPTENVSSTILFYFVLYCFTVLCIAFELHLLFSLVKE